MTAKKDSNPRFVVVGLHPAIDRTLEVPRLGAQVIRGKLILVEPSGKGANIAHTLSNFGRRVVATGFLGREDRAFFLSSFRRDTVTPRFVTVEGRTRENITVIERHTGRDIHITAGKLLVTAHDTERLLAVLKREVRRGDWAVFSGSRPAGFSLRDYARALKICAANGARICGDCEGPMLRVLLRHHPWLIKPNREELSEFVGRRLASLPQVLQAARELLGAADNVLVSLGAAGAILVRPDGAWRARDPRKVRLPHTVGCGDAIMAGFLFAASVGRQPAEALRFAVACGSACVRSPFACVRSKAEAARAEKWVRVATLQT